MLCCRVSSGVEWSPLELFDVVLYFVVLPCLVLSHLVLSGVVLFCLRYSLVLVLPCSCVVLSGLLLLELRVWSGLGLLWLVLVMRPDDLA